MRSRCECGAELVTVADWMSEQLVLAAGWLSGGGRMAAADLAAIGQLRQSAVLGAGRASG